jgi:FMN hydrolase / 5-amino-6-(5-phospho-D-ribitylamino)uracil phosphatase
VTLRALTLDLDDTLWPVWPAIERAEQALHGWLALHAPRCAARYPVTAMRALRDRVARENPHLAHDFSAQRKLSLAAALADSDEDPAHAEAAFEVFFAGRNQVELYPEVPGALARLAARFPLAALTNGNADLGRIGLRPHFVFELGAREHGRAKPDASIFLAACARLECAPHEVLHVGDDPELDVLGAQRAGLRTAWLNRHDARWAHDEAPDLSVRDLAELADRLEHPTPFAQDLRLRTA